MQKTPKSEIELYDEEADSDHIRIGKGTKRPESESVDTSRFITEAAAKQAALDRAEISSDSSYRQVVELFAEAIQCEPPDAAEESWGVTVYRDNDNIMTVP